MDSFLSSNETLRGIVPGAPPPPQTKITRWYYMLPGSCSSTQFGTFSEWVCKIRIGVVLYLVVLPAQQQHDMIMCSRMSKLLFHNLHFVFPVSHGDFMGGFLTFLRLRFPPLYLPLNFHGPFPANFLPPPFSKSSYEPSKCWLYHVTAGCNVCPRIKT